MSTPAFAESISYFGHMTTVGGKPTTLKVAMPSSAPKEVCLEMPNPRKKTNFVSGIYVEVKGEVSKNPKGCFRVQDIRFAVYDPARKVIGEPKK